MKVRNLRSYAVEIVDSDTDNVYECAARPGVVEVPAALGKRLLKQSDAWSTAEDDDKPSKTEKEG